MVSEIQKLKPKQLESRFGFWLNASTTHSPIAESIFGALPDLQKITR